MTSSTRWRAHGWLACQNNDSSRGHHLSRGRLSSASGPTAKSRPGPETSDAGWIVLQNPVVFIDDRRPGVWVAGLSVAEASTWLSNATATLGKQLQTMVGHARAA